MYYFLQEDFQKLNQQIEDICTRIKEIGKDMGESCREGAETFHDNFAYEDGERQQYMLSKRLRELIGIRNNSHIVTSQQSSDTVTIGKTVVVCDQSGNKDSFRIGSFMTFTPDDSVISYNSPLARLITGAKIGEIRSGKIGHSQKQIRVISIS